MLAITYNRVEDVAKPDWGVPGWAAPAVSARGADTEGGRSLMEFKKHSLVKLQMPYPLGVVMRNGKRCVVGATEDHGPIVLAQPPFDEAVEMVPGPGGCMALVADSEKPDTLFAIMGCFVGYKFQTAGVYRISPDQEGAAEKIIELPFAHRIDFVNRGGARFLIAATLAADKRDPGDWSRPGTLYASHVPRSPGEGWELTPVLEGIHRNHGLLTARLMGRRSVLISGAEGLFAADLDSGGDDWGFQQVLGQEVSEIAVSDIDGDGADELITIEPFHGNSLRVYKRAGSKWQLAWETGLEYGHCLLAGMLKGVRSILVSNRAGNRDLLLFEFTGPPGGRGIADPKRHVVDPGAGAANMLVVSHDGTDRIFSTNQTAGEIVSYTPF